MSFMTLRHFLEFKKALDPKFIARGKRRADLTNWVGLPLLELDVF